MVAVVVVGVVVAVAAVMVVVKRWSKGDDSDYDMVVEVVVSRVVVIHAESALALAPS